jgi:hypothetical protein
MHGKSFSERFRSKPENAAKAAARAAARTIPRVNRSDCYYVKLHIAHLVELIEMNDPAAFMLFGMLLARPIRESAVFGPIDTAAHLI